MEFARSKVKQKSLLIVALGAFLAFAAAGCGSSDADLNNGRNLFIVKCGTCHTLAEAGSNNPTGPDLDAAFAAAREAGMDDDTVEGVVSDQISNPRFTDPADPAYMPANIVTGTDAEDVAAYVGSVAGVPGIQPPEAPGGPGGQVFASNSCGSCHTLAAAESNGVTGPNLDESIAGWSTAEIEKAIVDPSADIAPGYQDGVMPSYEGQIPPEDLKLLVDFLAESAGQAGGGQ